MKAPATQGNVTDHMYRGPFDENCKPINTANPPVTKDDSSLTCSTVYKPVCAITKENNKKTFDNECQAKKYGGNIVDFNKSCEDKSDGNKSEVICPKEYKPVCTVTPDGNKKTQDNECKAKAMGLKIVDSYKGCEHKAYDYSQDKKYDDKGNYDYKKDSERYKGGDDDKKYATTDVMYWLKDTERMVQDFKRYKLSEVKDGTKAKSILSKMEAKVKEARSEYDKGNSSKVQTLLKDVNGLRKSFEDSMDGFHNKKDREHIDKKMDFVKKEIEQMKLKLKKGSKNYDVCMKHANDGLAIVGKIKSAYTKEDWKTLESLKNTMMAIEDKASIDCRENYSNKADVNSFNTVYVDKKNYGISQAVIDQISKEVAKKVLENIKSNDNLVNKIYENTDKTLAKDIAKMFESVSLAPKKEQQDMLSQKASMLEKIKALEAKVSKLEAKNSEYEMLMTDIRKYNFTGTAGTKMQEELKKFNTYVATGSASDTEFKKKVAALKTETTKAKVQARYDKFSKGIIAFLDADDTEWYSKYAVQAKQLGYVKGTGDSGGTNLNPAGETNVAEAVTMFGRVIGGGEAGIIIQTGQTTKGLPSWSHAGAAALQKKGVNLDKLFNGKKADEKVTRAETAQLLKEVFKLSAGDASKFPDAKNASSSEKAAIGAVSAAGIMTGEGNGNFNSKGSLNRAAMVKVIMKAEEQNSVAATTTQ